MSVTKGVPQGIVHVSFMFTFKTYAFDTTLLLKDKNIDSLHAYAISELEKVHLRIQSNKVKLNISKTSFILFQNRSTKNFIPQLMLNEEKLNQVIHTKFLGIIVDESINCKLHIDRTCSR